MFFDYLTLCLQGMRVKEHNPITELAANACFNQRSESVSGGTKRAAECSNLKALN
jgi:hypothetical protein